MAAALEIPGSIPGQGTLFFPQRLLSDVFSGQALASSLIRIKYKFQLDVVKMRC